ncbi:MAG: hypothetical protein WC523_04780 [Patescibacteria group bacterium]
MSSKIVHKNEKKLKNITYCGPSLEFGKTSMFCNKPTPGINRLIKQGLLAKGLKILDYGAGKYARNTKYLVGQGFNSIAVDKFNYNEQYNVLKNKDIRDLYFDVSFTSYVLNVVSEYTESRILNKLSNISKTQCHIVRNDLVSNLDCVQKNKGPVYNWIIKNVTMKKEAKLFSAGQADNDCLIKLARFGFATPKGFQRLVFLENKGFDLIYSGAYKIYIK